MCFHDKTSINTSLCLLQGSFDCNGLYQWLPLRGVQSESSVGGETLALVNREHRWRLDLTAAAVPPDSWVSTFSFSLFSTNITFCFPHPVFSSWRIRLIYDMLPSVFWKKKNEEKKPQCQNNTVWLYVRKHARNFVSPDFYFDKFSAFVMYFCCLCFYVFTVLML